MWIIFSVKTPEILGFFAYGMCLLGKGMLLEGYEKSLPSTCCFLVNICKCLIGILWTMLFFGVSMSIFPRGKYLLILKEYGNNFRYYKRMNIW